MNSVIPCHIGHECRWPSCAANCDGRPGKPDEKSLLRADMAKLFDIDTFTCDECGMREHCDLAFDPYNVNGGCLVEK